jgi:4-diphosphocytidyl-2-C-methyl-D-erythritol kinase
MNAGIRDGQTPVVRRDARAKLNLGLAVTGRRSDGYHELRSVFLRIGLSDRIEGRSVPGGVADSLSISGDPGCEVDGNLVLRATAELRSRFAADLPPLAFRLHKAIPLDAGLAGGSADAAATIDLAADAWGIGLAPQIRHSVAAELGADVPFFAADLPGALVGGVGEQLEPLPAVRGLGVLLVSPRVGCGTGAAFAAFDALPSSGRAEESRAVVESLASAIRLGMDGSALADWALLLRDANDLWPAAAAVAPTLVEVRELLEEHLDRPVLLTGSGSTLFALYSSSSDAADAGRSLAAHALPALGGARLAAVDEVGPDPAWRFP